MEKIPKLRFKEFIDEWEEKKLKNIATFSKGRLISKEDISETGIECIRYGELYTTYNEVINNVVSKTNLDISNLVLSEKNDIIIPCSGETAIDIAKASCVIKSGVALGGDLNILKLNENGIFLSYYLNNKAKHQIASLAQGASVVHLYEDHLKKLKVKIPNHKEQKKIADFLSAVDVKINLTEEKLELLKEYKKGMMQKIFNQELRFKDENGNGYPKWEEKKLGDVIKYFSGNSFPEVYQGNLNEKYPFYKVGDMNSINNNKFMFEANNYISEEVKTILKCKIAPENTIIFPKVGAALLTNKRRILTKDSIFDNNILGVKGKENDILNDSFLYFFMQTLDFSYFVQEGALPSISKNIIDKIEIKLPCIEEQQKIADFLSSIDNKIEKIADELENLKEFKKGLLQQMFI